MRWLSTILAAISSVLLILVLYFGVRSYWRYEGFLHFGQGDPLPAQVSAKGITVDDTVSGYRTGLISYRGQLTYVSIGFPMEADAWESWSHDARAPLGVGAMAVVGEARGLGGIHWGTTKTSEGLVGPGGYSWRLPYRYFTLPYWGLAIALAIGPYFWFANYRLAARREAKGLCVRCGKSVAGLTGKCPACCEPIPS